MVTTAEAMAIAAKKWSRVKHDHYPTPPDVTQALVTWLAANVDRPIRRVWEPACGEGQMAHVLEKAGYDVVATDLNRMGYGEQRDFLSHDESLGNFDAIITNPPFTLAVDFARKALLYGNDRCPVVAMLFKTQFYQAAKRGRFFRAHKPSFKLDLTWRPAFLAETRGKSPVMECCWVVWCGDTPCADVCHYDLLERPAGEATFLPPTLRVHLARAEAAREHATAGRT